MRRPPPAPVAHLDAFLARVADGDDETAVRVRRAMAGESPARFRDRLLLERAAHLARTTTRTLQDVAADCGFAGYDVFVRAFHRELGASPSQWRADPTSCAIDAPGDVHVQTPAGIRLPARSRVDAVDLLVTMAEQHVTAVGDLVDAAATAPGPAGAEARSALSEALGRMEALAALVHETSYGDTGALRARVDLAGPDFVAAVAALGAAGRFDEAAVDAFSPDPVVVTLGEVVIRAVTDADDLLRTARGAVG